MGDRENDIQKVEGMPNWAWEMYFSPKNGMIPHMNEKLNDVCKKLDVVKNKLEDHNEYEERIKDTEISIAEQVAKCAEIQVQRETRRETEFQIQERLEKARDAQSKEDYRKFMRIIKIIGAAAALFAIGSIIFSVIIYYASNGNNTPEEVLTWLYHHLL